MARGIRNFRKVPMTGVNAGNGKLAAYRPKGAIKRLYDEWREAQEVAWSSPKELQAHAEDEANAAYEAYYEALRRERGHGGA